MPAVDTTVLLSLGDTDAAGVVFHGRLFDHAQRGLERFLEACGFPIATLIAAGPRTPVIRAEAEFRLPMRLGERFTLRSEAAEVGVTSFRMRHAFLRDDGMECARVEVTHVAIDAHGRAIPLPEAFRAALAG